MRATATSATNSSTLSHVRAAPPAVELAELSLGVGPEPISAASTAPSDADTMQWAHGYSGCIGVSMNGSQPGSRGAVVAVEPVADGRHGTPEVVRVLRVEDGDQRIDHGHPGHGEETGVLGDVARGDDGHGARHRPVDGGRGRFPELRDGRLLGRAYRAVPRADGLDLVVVARP